MILKVIGLCYNVISGRILHGNVNTLSYDKIYGDSYHSIYKGKLLNSVYIRVDLLGVKGKP